MKKKQVTVLLIFSVSAVWGIIFYQLFNSASADSLPLGLTHSVIAGTSEAEIYPLTDTFELALNYRDPFLGESAVVASDIDMEARFADDLPAALDVPPSEPVITQDFIIYNGYITNPVTKRIVSIITLNGKEQMLEEGQSVAGLKLLKNHRDSVKIAYQDRTRFITLK